MQNLGNGQLYKLYQRFKCIIVFVKNSRELNGQIIKQSSFTELTMIQIQTIFSHTMKSLLAYTACEKKTCSIIKKNTRLNTINNREDWINKENILSFIDKYDLGMQ